MGDIERYESWDIFPKVRGNLSEDPGLIADWDQLHQEAVRSIRAADDFFFTATLRATEDGGIGLMTVSGFRELPDDPEEARRVTAEILAMLKASVEEHLTRSEED